MHELLDPSEPVFWVLVAFIGFMALLAYLGVPALIGKALDARAEGIRKELDEAHKLREDAQRLLADYQAKARDAENEARAIIEQAKREAEAMAAESSKALAESLERVQDGGRKDRPRRGPGLERSACHGRANSPGGGRAAASDPRRRGDGQQPDRSVDHGPERQAELTRQTDFAEITIGSSIKWGPNSFLGTIFGPLNGGSECWPSAGIQPLRPGTVSIAIG